MRCRWCLLLVLLLICVTVQAAGRVALVIGNGSYQDAPRLANTINDAKLMKSTLEKLNFKVLYAENASKSRMEEVVSQFGEMAVNADVALVYFSGHGLQVNGDNYLMPVEAKINKEADIPLRALPLNSLLAQLEGRQGANIIILDACRNNPFAGKTKGTSRGLARIQASTGTLVAYATEPGRTADDGDGANGRYTSILARKLTEPGLSIIDVFMQTRLEVANLSNQQQVPTEDNRLTQNIYLASNTPKNSAGGQTGVHDAAQLESETWQSALQVDTAVGYQEYLNNYPHGRFVGSARIRRAAAAAKEEKAQQAGNRSTPIPSTVPTAAPVAETSRPAKPNTHGEANNEVESLQAKQAVSGSIKVNGFEMLLPPGDWIFANGASDDEFATNTQGRKKVDELHYGMFYQPGKRSFKMVLQLGGTAHRAEARSWNDKNCENDANNNLVMERFGQEVTTAYPECLQISAIPNRFIGVPPDSYLGRAAKNIPNALNPPNVIYFRYVKYNRRGQNFFWGYIDPKEYGFSEAIWLPDQLNERQKKFIAALTDWSRRYAEVSRAVAQENRIPAAALPVKAFEFRD